MGIDPLLTGFTGYTNRWSLLFSLFARGGETADDVRGPDSRK